MSEKTNKISFEDNLKNLEFFLVQNKKLPTIESDKKLYQWMVDQRKYSNYKTENRDKIINLLEKYNLKSKRLGLKNKTFEEVSILLENYIRDNGTDEISEEQSYIYYGLDIKSWIIQARVDEKKKFILENIYEKYNLDMLKRPSSLTKYFKDILFFCYEYKIIPSSLDFIFNGKSSYQVWFRYLKRNFKENKTSKDFQNEIIFNKIDEKFDYEYFFDIEILKIFFNQNSKIDLESNNKVYLVVNKKENELFASYRVEIKKTKIINKIVDGEELSKIDFCLYYDIKEILKKLRLEKEKLHIEDKNFVEEYNKINFNLEKTKIKIKNIIFKKINRPFYYIDYEYFINQIFKDVVANSKIGSVDYNLISNLDLSQTDIAKKSNLSRQRLEQILSSILNNFELHLNNNICFLNIDSNKSLIIKNHFKEELKIISTTNFTEELKMEKNTIYYGSPGTGKSHLLSQKITSQNIFSCMFHEEYTYFDFVGQYKPVMYTISNSQMTNVFNELNQEIELYKNKSPTIVYSFVAGVFLKAYVKAKKTNKPVFLIIEEINRGNCSSIFGDIFQLLDRNDNGESKYSIDTSNEIASFLKQEEIDNYYELRIPSNLYIISTMNTSDQSLFNMDSAFKRRWDLEFVPINYNENNFKIEGTNLYWGELLLNINNLIIAVLESENKCLGQWFIKSENNEIKQSKFKNKVLHYLYFDVFHNDRELVFESFEYSKVLDIKIDDFNTKLIELYNKKIQGD